MKIKKLIKQAKKSPKIIVFPEAGFSDRTLEAVKIIQKKGIAKPLLIGDESALILRDKKLNEFQITSPMAFQETKELAMRLYQKRKDKGATIEECEKLIQNPYYFATMLVEAGYADGIVAGAEGTTAEVIKPALQIIKTKKKDSIASETFLVYGKNKLIKHKYVLLSDCSLNITPSSDDLNEIANQTVQTYKALGLGEPKVAFLSYSTKGSGRGEGVDKVRKAYEKFKKSGVVCDGELQLDSALVKRVAKIKAPQSPLAGDANILIFPNLESGNICYKAIEYFGDLHAIGTISQGLKRPVNVL